MGANTFGEQGTFNAIEGLYVHGNLMICALCFHGQRFSKTVQFFKSLIFLLENLWNLSICIGQLHQHQIVLLLKSRFLQLFLAEFNTFYAKFLQFPGII